LGHGGGYLLASGCYAVMFSQFSFGEEKPQEIHATGQLDEKGLIKEFWFRS
jgi:hypothetical protein